MPMARMAGGSGTRAWRRTLARAWRAAGPAGAARGRPSPPEPKASNPAIVGGRPVAGSLRSRTSSPTISPGRGRPSAREKLTSRTAAPPPGSARLRLEGFPVLGGVLCREGADGLDGAEQDGQDPDEDDQRGERRTRVPDAEEAQGHRNDAADEVGPPVGQVVVADGVDDVEDPEHEEAPADETGDDEDGDVRPHEADDARPHPDHAKNEKWPALAGRPQSADDLKEPDGDEEPAGQVDDGVDAGVPVADHEEAEDHGDDAPAQVPAPHLLELRADDIADRDLVVCQYVRHGFPLGE